MNAALASAPGLWWGLKRSFLSYLAGMPETKLSVSGGAAVSSEGLLFWPPVEGSGANAPSGPETAASPLMHPGFAEYFRGEIRFRAHRGMLYVRLGEPIVCRDGVRGTMSFLATQADGTQARVALAEFDAHPLTPSFEPPDPIQMWAGTGVRLMASGVSIFNGVYPVGESMEDFVCTATQLNPAGAVHVSAG